MPIKDENKLTLHITSIGYFQKEVEIDLNNSLATALQITLKTEVKILDEMIVTGVFDSRKRIESSIAITTIKSRDMERIVPNSAMELLRLVPGVFVNTTRGEIYNSIVARGMVLGDYVSMQEDGLPIITVGGQFEPSPFLRADVSTGRIEAVRGGTASILGVNAPGGIFNYITRTGTANFEGEVRTRFGLEGNGKNPYYRLEAGFGGPLGKRDSSLTYFVGGHYRHADGAKYPGYPLSRGGQVKANLVKKYKQGYFQLNLKYLHDRTVQFESTPTVDFDDPRPAGDFTNSSSLLNPNAPLDFPASILGLTGVSYESKNLNLYKDFAPGFNWEHRFGNGWKVQNAFRYSDKSALVNSSFIVYPYSVDKFFFYAFNNLLGKFGTYRFYNPKTGQEYGTVTQEYDADNFKFNADLNLPGGAVQPNSVLYNPISFEKSSMKDVVNQFTLKKQLENMGFTAGMYHSTTWLEQYLTPPAATGFGTIEDQPQFVGIDYVPAGVDNPPTYHVTDQNGIAGYGNGGLFYNKGKVEQTAFFFGHNWNISEKLNLDWGFRTEYFKIKGNSVRTTGLTTSLGGVDGDSTTLYDNDTYILGDYVPYDSPLNTYAFSGGLNYKVNNGLSFYARYSQGSKTPDFNFFYDNALVLKAEAQHTLQIELGVKVSKGKSNLFVTSFYSALDKVPYISRGQNEGLPVTFYELPKLYNKTHAIGVEMEGNCRINEHWNIRANAMIQQFTADRFQYWDSRQGGRADDTLIDRSNKMITMGAPPYIFNITPEYQYNKLFVSLNWYRIAKRAANSSETFYLPAFSQFDLNVGYEVSKKIRLQFVVNNMLNKFGIMSWTGPTTSGLPFETFDFELFTPEKRAANPDAVYHTYGIQPRAYFLNCTIKL